ncbi:MAG: hypothetical protein KJO81_06345 [Gammaproteobacteria bacterium]|nr:hypothetical protein [Gammaproteobacteria bacterium]
MDDANKVLRITSYLNSIWPADKVDYKLLPKEALHRFTHTTKYLKQAFYISANYLSDHKMSAMLSDMDTRHVKETIMSKDNPETFFLGYTSSGRVIFSVLDDENSVGVGNT